ncbi:outer membrane beta-barrel protein, partial [Microbacteriaceae bacterium K1510]|nr:outer membrane beta-barrel protein [Microbacteriaceae bacterium K1510]
RLGSVRGRVGFAAAPELLIFATGGFAWAHSDFAGVNRGSSSSRSTSFGETREGYVVGAGTDWAPWHDNWVLRLEYLHYEFSGTSSTVFFPNPNTFYWDDESVDSVRAGLSYKF